MFLCLRHVFCWRRAPGSADSGLLTRRVKEVSRLSDVTAVFITRPLLSASDEPLERLRECVLHCNEQGYS